MATIQQLAGRWRLVDSKGFEDYMKELDGLQLYRWRIGSAPGVGWEGKHNNQKIERWEVSRGVCHEQYHLYSGL
ncbi:fatty acid-binding protein, epidermal isoform X2 [Heterocephalus glaber]|uniref:Fatty acid-binding protein, epidermal isoform X2 n=1 Tax=Heterocephalus glaber TaxID=10181 RepID=A0AAX6SSK4_HETGA|nr:fatty acid-binding protein, epidermal isoform X2 [Heterocephalus glaber]